MSELEEILSKLHTTLLGEDRICRNLKIAPEDLTVWCRKEISKNFKSIQKRGKNYYIETETAVFTINGSAYTIITAHKIKNGGKSSDRRF